MVCSCLYLVSYARFDIERTIMRFCLQNQMLSMEVFAQLCRVRGISDPTVYAALVASEAPVSVALDSRLYAHAAFVASTSSDYAAFVASGASMSIPWMLCRVCGIVTYAAFVASAACKWMLTVCACYLLYYNVLNYNVALLPTACPSLNCYCA